MNPISQDARTTQGTRDIRVLFSNMRAAPSTQGNGQVSLPNQTGPNAEVQQGHQSQTGTTNPPTPMDKHPATSEMQNPFRILTWNVMGLTTVREELRLMAEEHAPDVLVLTETKLVDKYHASKWLADSLPRDQYTLYCSSKPSHNPLSGHNRALACSRLGAGGVMVAVHNRWVTGSRVVRITVDCRAERPLRRTPPAAPKQPHDDHMGCVHAE